MSSQLKVTVTIEQDGIEVRRIVRRVGVDEVQGFSFEKATGGGYSSIPTEQIAALSVLVLEPLDEAVTLRLNGQSDAGVLLAAGSLLVLVDGTLNAGASTNATLSNGSGNTALIHGLAGGT